MPRIGIAGLVVAIAFGVAVPAVAEVDAEVPLAAKAKGTILPAGEIDLYRFQGTRGTLLSLTCAASGRSPLQPTVLLFDEDSLPVVVPDAAPDPRSFKATGFALPSSGEYSLEVSGAGTGAYSLSLKGKVRTKWEAGFGLLDSATGTLDFAAPPGSTLVVEARAGKGSLAVPRLLVLHGESADRGLVGTGVTTPTRHTVTLSTLPDGGEFSLVVRNEGVEGAVIVKAKVKPPKTRSLKLDLRAEKLGHPEGGETYRRDSVGASGGVVICDEAGCELYGAAAEFPAGAFPGETGVSLASATAPELEGDADQPAGPAVDFGPAKVAPSMPVAVTLPLDPQRLPVGADAGDARVLVVDRTGSRVVVPESHDVAGATVTLDVTGACRLLPVVAAGMPRLEDREYWGLFRSARISTDATGDSRVRSAGVERVAISFSTGGAGNALVYGREVQYENLDAPSPGMLLATAEDSAWTDSGPFTWFYGADGQTVVVDTGGGETTTLVASRDGSILVGSPGNAEPWAGCDIFVRKDAVAPTVAGLAGAYHMVLAEWAAEGTAASGAAWFRPARLLGVLTLDGAGGGTLVLSGREDEFDQASASWIPETFKRTFQVSCEVMGDGTVRVGILEPDPGAPPLLFSLRAGEGGRVLLGVDAVFEPNVLRAVAVVRQGTDLGTKSLTGDYRGFAIGLEPHHYPVGSPPDSVAVPDFSLWSEEILGTFAGISSASILDDWRGMVRNPEEPGGVEVSTRIDTFPATVSVTRQGRVTLTASEGGILGLLTDDASAVFLLNDPAKAADDDFSWGLLVKPPPLK